MSIPKIDFNTFVISVASAAYMGLGIKVPGMPDQGEGTEKNLELAKQNIDLLELMQIKTKGNLSSEESRLLEQLLFETRMRFVEASKG